MSRPEMESAILASQINCAICTFIVGTIFLLNCVSLWENRKDINFKNAKKRWRIPLCLAAGMSLIVFIQDGLVVWKRWIPGQDEQGCVIIVWFIVWCYILEKQLMNLFLYDRAKIVHESLQLSSKKAWYLSMLRWFLWLTLVIGVPLCFYWAAPVTFSGKIPIEGDCIYYNTWPIIIVIFAVADGALASGMLLIFLIPLVEHNRMMQHTQLSSNLDTTSTKLQGVIRHNIICSSVALCSSVVGLSVHAALLWTSLEKPGSEGEYLQVWALFAISWDNMFGICAIHAMTRAWLPRALQPAHFSKPNQIEVASHQKNPPGTTDAKRTALVAASSNGEREPGSSSYVGN